MWQEVAGLCGFWDGSYENGKCGSDIILMAFSEPQGWSTFYKKRGPVPGHNSLDAEMGGCGMLIDSIQQWIESAPAKSGRFE